MRLAVHCSNLTWPGGPAELGPTLAGSPAPPTRAASATLTMMDHYFQMERSADRPSRCWRATRRSASSPGRPRSVELGLLVTGVTYRHPGLLAKIVTTLDVLSGGRAMLGLGAAWYEREHAGPRRPVPAHVRALRAAGGDAADLPPDVERRRRRLRRAALPAGRDDLRPAAGARRAAADPDRRRRRAEDAAAGRAVRRRLQPVRRRARRGRHKLDVLDAALRDRGPRPGRDPAHRHRSARTRSTTSTGSCAGWRRTPHSAIEQVWVGPDADRPGRQRHRDLRAGAAPPRAMSSAESPARPSPSLGP